MVDQLYKEFGNYFLHYDILLPIIKSTKYPHFYKVDENGGTYMIKINHIDDNILADIIDNMNRSNSHKVTELKWFPAKSLMNQKSKLSDSMLHTINKHNILTFLINQHIINTNIDNMKHAYQLNLIQKLWKYHKKITRDRELVLHKWAKFHDSQMTYFKTIPYDKIVILYNYTYDQYLNINKHLRHVLRFGFDLSTELLKKRAVAMVKYISDARTIINIVVNAPTYSLMGCRYIKLYRGLSFDPKLNIGQSTSIFRYNLNSCSINKDTTANLFVPTGGSLFKLILPPDVRMLILHGLSHYSYEDEILLPPGATFRIIKKYVQYNKHLNVKQMHYVAVLQNWKSPSNTLNKYIESSKQLNM